MLQQLSGQDILKIYIEDIPEEEKLPETPLVSTLPLEEDGVFEEVMKQLQECVFKVENEFPGIKNQVENGFKSFDENVIQHVKNTVISVIEETPYDPNALYLLACAESLLGNVKEGIDTLEKAINSGYRDFNRIVNDIELENIKSEIGYSQIVEKLRRILTPVDSSIELSDSDVFGEKEEDPVVEEERVVGLEEKVDKLAEVCEGLDKDLIRDLLVECHEDTDEVMSLIYSTFKF